LNANTTKGEAMRFATYVIYAGEGYCPDSITTRKPDLRTDSMRGYNDLGDTETHDEMGATLVIEANSICEARLIWSEFMQGCTRIRGADDDHYDYFPSHFDGLVDLAFQIDEAAGDSWCTDIANRVWDDHAYDNWSHNHVLKNDLDFAAREFADEIVPRPTGNFRDRVNS
jgi:hypothetical protein